MLCTNGNSCPLQAADFGRTGKPRSCLTLLVALALALFAMAGAQGADRSPGAPESPSRAHERQVEKAHQDKRKAAHGPEAAHLIVPHVPLITPYHEPRVSFANGVQCYYRSPFFDQDVRAVQSFPTVFQALLFEDDFSGPVFTAKVARAGAYMHGLPDPSSTVGSINLQIDCDGVKTPFLVNPATDPTADITLPVNATLVTLAARQGGATVTHAAPGSVVELVATPSAGNVQSFLWAANEGSVKSLNAPTTQWKLPNGPGLHFAYVLISDSNGGRAEASVTVATDVPAGNPPAPGPVNPASAKLPNLDHFLTYFSTSDFTVYNTQGADSRLGSCQYYLALGVVAGCTPHGDLVGPKLTFKSWLHKWHFNTPGNHEAKALYQNLADLNLQRDMHALTNASGTASYVCNYPGDDPSAVTLDNARHHQNLVACVAMEYSPGVGGGAPFVKFITFGPGGELFQSVNLDGRGEKFMPGACVVCHGAFDDGNVGYGHYPENGSGNPNLSATFLPFDVENFAFANHNGLRRPDQEPAFLALNKIVLDTNPNPAVVDVITLGYSSFASSVFLDDQVPLGWDISTPIPGAANGLTPRNLYLGAIRPSCRTCHAAMAPAAGLDFRDFATFDGLGVAVHRVCGTMDLPINGQASAGSPRKNYSMPNSKVTFDRFWSNTPPPPAGITRTQAQLFEDYSQATEGTATCQAPD